MDDKAVTFRIKDAIRLCEKTESPKFVGFLRPEESGVAQALAVSLKANHEFFGGYADAERVFFAALPDWCDGVTEHFPIEAITFTFRKEAILCHRDFLGALMSLGITREAVGDILIESGRAVAFFTKEISDYVFNQVDKVGNTGVVLSKGFTLPLPGMSDFKPLSITVASLRLDCVVAALVGCSRNKATELIECKLVSVNSVCTEKTVKLLSEGDTVTVRSKGKFVIVGVDGCTKKNRIILKAKKYI